MYVIQYKLMTTLYFAHIRRELQIHVIYTWFPNDKYYNCGYLDGCCIDVCCSIQIDDYIKFCMYHGLKFMFIYSVFSNDKYYNSEGIDGWMFRCMLFNIN